MDKRLKNAIVRAAVVAGINAVKSLQRNATFKSAHDLVTETDRANERTITDDIRKIDPKISILGEENGMDKRGSERLLVIDPLDGTTNFVKGIGLYSVMISYFEAGKPKLGVVYVPSTKDIYIAETGEGAFLNKRQIRASDKTTLRESLVSCNRSNYPDELVPTGLGIIERLMRNALSWRNAGTAGVEYAWVAAGKLDGIVTPLAEGVHYAGYILMEEAGAKVTDHLGKPVSLESSSIVAANPMLHGQLIDLVRPVFMAQGLR